MFFPSQFSRRFAATLFRFCTAERCCAWCLVPLLVLEHYFALCNFHSYCNFSSIFRFQNYTNVYPSCMVVFCCNIFQIWHWCCSFCIGICICICLYYFICVFVFVLYKCCMVVFYRRLWQDYSDLALARFLGKWSGRNWTSCSWHLPGHATTCSSVKVWWHDALTWWLDYGQMNMIIFVWRQWSGLNKDKITFVWWGSRVEKNKGGGWIIPHCSFTVEMSNKFFVNDHDFLLSTIICQFSYLS